MSFDGDEMITYKGKLISKGVVFHKVKSLGWSTRLFATLEDSEIITVLEERKTPQQMGKNPSTTFDPKQIIDVNSEEGAVTEIMAPGNGIPTGVSDGPVPLGVPVGESGVALAAVAPSTTGKHLRPVDPTRPAAPAAPMAPTAPAGAQPAPFIPQPPRPVTITVKPPRTDRVKLQSMLEAAYALAQNEGTHPTAKTLITANGLERPFQSLHTDLYQKLFGKLDLTPDSKCRGGIVLDIEMEPDNGYIHIITTAGTITITGQQLAHKGADA